MGLVLRRGIRDHATGRWLDALASHALSSLFASEVEKGGPEMMHMNTTGVNTPRLACAGTRSFGAFQNVGTPAFI